MSTEEEAPKQQFIEESTAWLNQALTENPQYADMRERALTNSQGMSFSHVVQSETMTAESAIYRSDLLELVYQHLCAIGMKRTAEILVRESGLSFQKSSQPWNKTDLSLLISLAIGHREDPWNVPPTPNHIFANETIEEDNFASAYTEDPKDIWKELADKKLNAVYSDDSQPTFANLRRGSLKRIIVFLVEFHEGTLRHMKDSDMQLIFLSLHSMTSSDHFFKHLVTLYDGDPDSNGATRDTNLDSNGAKKEGENDGTKKDDDGTGPKKEKGSLSFLRKNIIDTIKKWVNFHGLFIGRKTLKSVELFLTRIYNSDIDETYKKIIASVLSIIPNLHYGIRLGESSKAPAPDIHEPEIFFRPNLTLLMPPPTIVAQQISAYQLKVFASVHSREFIIGFSNRAPTIQTPTLNEFLAFGKHIQHLFLDAYDQLMKEKSPRIAFQAMLAVADELAKCKSFDSLANLVLLLKRNELQTLSQATKDQIALINKLWESCGKDGEDMAKEDGSQTDYEKTIQDQYNSWASCIPNMTAELKSIKVSVTKQPDFIDGLINWEKKRVIAERAHILYRFQNQSTFQAPISQIQKVISSIPDTPFEVLMNRVTNAIEDMEFSKK